MIKEAIGKIVDGIDLDENESFGVFDEIMSGNATDSQIGAFITALRIKGEKIPEITGAAKVMRKKAQHIKCEAKFLIDTCGTGGDMAGTFNISTTAAFVAAGAGLTVAKHGNRSVSSKSGSADMLKALGVNIDAEVTKIETCLAEAGIGFLFAPLLHQAMKYAIGPRREIGIRTIFNILGPLTNPAGAKCQIIGVYDPSITEKIASVLKELGGLNVLVVHGLDGLDEITLTGKTKVSHLKDNKVTTYEISPEEFGLTLCKSGDLKGGDAAENAKITLSVLNGETGPKRDITLLNAAAAIMAGGKANNINEGILLAKKSIDSGEALRRLEKLKGITSC